jgi:hypothetical protein
MDSYPAISRRSCSCRAGAEARPALYSFRGMERKLAQTAPLEDDEQFIADARVRARFRGLLAQRLWRLGQAKARWRIPR